MLSNRRYALFPGSSSRTAAWSLLALAIAMSFVAESPHTAAAWACAWPAHLGSSGAFFLIWASHCSGVRIDGRMSYFPVVLGCLTYCGLPYLYRISFLCGP